MIFTKSRIYEPKLQEIKKIDHLVLKNNKNRKLIRKRNIREKYNLFLKIFKLSCYENTKSFLYLHNKIKYKYITSILNTCILECCKNHNLPLYQVIFSILHKNSEYYRLSDYVNFCETPEFVDYIQRRRYSFTNVYDMGMVACADYSILQYIRKHECDWYHFLNVGITYYDYSLIKYAVQKIGKLKDVYRMCLEIFADEDEKIFNFFSNLIEKE